MWPKEELVEVSQRKASVFRLCPPLGPIRADSIAAFRRSTEQGSAPRWSTGCPPTKPARVLGHSSAAWPMSKFIGSTLYALLAGAGCSHGLINTTNGVIRVEKDGHWSLVADLSAFQKKNPVANPNPGDFEPDGTWYSMVSVGDLLFAMEPNHGELDLISPFGLIRRASDISASEGHIVPTSVVFHNGYFYFGNLGLFPIVSGSSNVYRLDPFRND
jgi:hypothetical protein